MTSPLDHLKQSSTKSPNAEIMIWDTRTDMDFNFGNDTVQGYIDTNEVAQWIYVVSQAKDLDDLYDKATQFKLVMPA